MNESEKERERKNSAFSSNAVDVPKSTTMLLMYVSNEPDTKGLAITMRLNLIKLPMVSFLSRSRL